MKKWIRYLAGVVAVTALLAVVTDTGAETCKLEIKKVAASRRGGSRQDQMFRSTYPQGIFMQIGGPKGMVSRSGDKDKPEFSKLIKKEPNLFALIAEAFKSSMKASPPSVAPSTIAARATKGYKAVKFVKNKTVALPFGPPYRPLVSVQYRQGAGKVSLSMSLVGMADEICSSLRVNGRQPGKPKFTISTEDGKEVESGAFEYG